MQLSWVVPTCRRWILSPMPPSSPVPTTPFHESPNCSNTAKTSQQYSPRLVESEESGQNSDEHFHAFRRQQNPNPVASYWEHFWALCFARLESEKSSDEIQGEKSVMTQSPLASTRRGKKLCRTFPNWKSHLFVDEASFFFSPTPSAVEVVKIVVPVQHKQGVQCWFVFKICLLIGKTWTASSAFCHTELADRCTLLLRTSCRRRRWQVNHVKAKPAAPTWPRCYWESGRWTRTYHGTRCIALRPDWKSNSDTLLHFIKHACSKQLIRRRPRNECQLGEDLPSYAWGSSKPRQGTPKMTSSSHLQNTPEIDCWIS